MRLRERIIKSTALNFIAVVFNQGSTFVVNIIVARILLKNVFGEYAMVQSTLLTVATLSQLSTGYTVAKYIAEYRFSDPKRAGRIMGLCGTISILMALIGTIILISMAPWLAGTMLHAPHLALSLIVGSGYLFFSSINGYQTGALAGFEAYGGLAKAGVLGGIITIFTITIFSWWLGLNGALLGLSLSALIRCAIHNWWLRYEIKIQQIKPTYRGSFLQEKDVLFKFALPAAISGLYMTPMIWLAQSFLVRQPGGYGEMALFSAANNLRIIVLFLPNVFNVVSLSILNNAKGNGDINRYNQVFKTSIQVMFFVSLCIAFIIGIFGKSVLLLFGKEFSSGNILLWCLLIAGIFESLSTAIFQYLQTNAKLWFSFFSVTLPSYTCLALLSYVLVKSHKGVGLATSYLGSSFLLLTLTSLLVVILNKRNHITLVKNELS